MTALPCPCMFLPVLHMCASGLMGYNLSMHGSTVGHRWDAGEHLRLNWTDGSRYSNTSGTAMYRGERFNSISHLIGAALSLVGLVLLVVMAARQGDPWKIVSFSIYGTTLLLLYTFSTLYHSLKGQAKKVFRRLDHLAIYLLIAGTYTPFTLITLRGSWGWSIFGAIWFLAIIGSILEWLPLKGQRILPVIVYILMGWLIVIAFRPLLHNLTLSGLLWLLTGGIFYTTGVFFYALDKKISHFHGIWHIFVMAGSFCHYVTILYYVV